MTWTDFMHCGIDEVGRGCLAGDVYAAAVVFHSPPPEGVRDSKKLTHARRVRMDALIRAAAHVSIGTASVEEIERVNILNATMLAMMRAYQGLPDDVQPVRILVDGNRVPKLSASVSVHAVVGGDGLHACIGAASIVAKVARDARMDRLHELHPEYCWNRNRGYGSPAHLRAIELRGPTSHHRMTFSPLRQPALALEGDQNG